MFDFDLSQGSLFEKDGKEYAIIKGFSWIAGQKETGKYRVEVKMCIPTASHGGLEEWVEFEPKFFVNLKKLDGGEK